MVAVRLGVGDTSGPFGIPDGKYDNLDSPPQNQPGNVWIKGNVGIGTTSPSYKLDVSGQIRSSSGGFVFPDNTTQTTSAGARTWFVEGITLNPTTSGTWVNLPEMSITLTPRRASNPIVVLFNGQFRNSNDGAPEVRIVIDGAEVIKSRRTGNPGGAPGEEFVVPTQIRTNLSVAPHTIKIQWRTENDRAGVVTAINNFRSLLIMELLGGEIN